MLLIIGGAASGKREVARQKGFTDEQMSDAVIDDRPVVYNVQNLVSTMVTTIEAHDPQATITQIHEQVSDSLCEQLARKEAVICDEQGCGVIPLTPHDRRTREAAGRLCNLLAKQADQVIRVVCGVPQVLFDRSRLITVTIMRHGKTPSNLKHAYNGRRTNEPLSDKGVAEACAYGADPSVTHVYVTPLRRTAQTAELLFPNARQTVVEGLAEMDFGDFEGRSAQEMEDDPAYRTWVDSNCNDPCPNGEDRESFMLRTCAAFTQLVHQTDEHDERQLYIVAHGGTLMSVLGTYGVPRRPYWDWIANNCCGYRFTVDPLTWDAAPVAKDPVPVEGPAPAQDPSLWTFDQVAAQGV